MLIDADHEKLQKTNEERKYVVRGTCFPDPSHAVNSGW